MHRQFPIFLKNKCYRNTTPSTLSCKVARDCGVHGEALPDILRACGHSRLLSEVCLKGKHKKVCLKASMSRSSSMIYGLTIG
jgi:hypothetical protein